MIQVNHYHLHLKQGDHPMNDDRTGRPVRIAPADDYYGDQIRDPREVNGYHQDGRHRRPGRWLLFIVFGLLSCVIWVILIMVGFWTL